MSETHAITVEKVLPCPPEPIWRALTTSELIATWLLPNDFTAVVGHRFNFRARPVGTWDGVVHCDLRAAASPTVFLERRLGVRTGARHVRDLDADADRARHAAENGARRLRAA
jgi:hypothetical protein